MNRFVLSVGCAALMSAVLVGCGGKSELKFEQAAVSGTVTWQGKPVEEGLIRFIPDEVNSEGLAPGKPAFSKITNGDYAVPADRGATVGKNRVEIVSFRKTGRMIEEEGTKSEENVQFLPEQYNTSSTLTADIVAGENTVNFDLTGQ